MSGNNSEAEARCLRVFTGYNKPDHTILQQSSSPFPRLPKPHRCTATRCSRSKVRRRSLNSGYHGRLGWSAESIEHWVRLELEIISSLKTLIGYADPEYEMRQLKVFQKMVEKGASISQCTAYFDLP